MDKIAVLVDSGCDIPKELAVEKNIYILPLKINYTDGEYRDGVDITPEQVYSKLAQEIPKTSLPNGEEILNLFDKIKSDGYNKVLCVTLSSGLSGTNNIINIIASDYDGLEIKIIDSKNIAIGAGFLGLLASDLIQAGQSFDESYQGVLDNINNSKVFFSVATLEYLHKGGRIGLVSAVLGSKINLKPIISCNNEGIYYTIAKVIGRNQSIKKMLDLVVKYAETGDKYNVCISHGGAFDEAQKIKQEILKRLPNVLNVYEGQISPTLGVHTGPGLVGVGIQLL